MIVQALGSARRCDSQSSCVLVGGLDSGFADVSHSTVFHYYFSLPSVHTTFHLANFVFLRSLGSSIIAVLDAVF